MTDETQQGANDAAATSVSASDAPTPSAPAATPEASEGTTTAAETSASVNNSPIDDATQLKVTALHLAIDHAKSHSEQRQASEIVEWAEAFWTWLKKEVA